MKKRSELSAGEVVDLHSSLERRLESIGLASQPEVVLRLLELASNPESQLNEFAKVIRTDHAISGRVLKLANSALFAQRSPVTSLERACLVLGLERLKSVSLGFHLSRAASCGHNHQDGRVMWGQSVLRACVAGEAARIVAPSHVPEAYLVGLMMDAGLPLMPRLAGAEYGPIEADQPSPGRRFRLEDELLPFTHVDVVSVMARRWHFPEMLAKPLAWHHTKPTDAPTTDTLGRLHRVAYVVGMLDLGQTPAISKDTPGVATAARVLTMSERDMGVVVSRSAAEYAANIALFSDVATSVGEGEDLVDRIQRAMVDAVDRAVQTSINQERAAEPRRLILSGFCIELVREPDGTLLACLYDRHGMKLVSHRVPKGPVHEHDIFDGLGLGQPTPEDRASLATYLQGMAA